MADRLTPAARSRLMSAVKSKNTGPELTVRHIAHALGYRCRLHCRDMPGQPDLVFLSRRKVIFIHVCFWDRHPECRKATTPKSNVDFWTKKFERNVERDELSEHWLRVAGWDVLTIWECQTRDQPAISRLLTVFLGAPGMVGATMELP